MIYAPSPAALTQGVFEFLARSQHKVPEPVGLEITMHGTVPLGE